MTADNCQHIYSICSKLLARAVASCRPSSSLQSVQQVAVTLRNNSHLVAERQVNITISDTGKALPDDIKVLKTTFSGLFTNGAESICEQEVVVKSTEMHESSIRVYKVTPGTKSSTNPAVSIARLPLAAKQSRLPFAGSEISFQLLSNVHAEDVINCVQAVLELSSMIAPRTYLELRLKGFAIEGNAEAAKPGSVTLKYDIEPLPSDMTAEHRFFEGLKAWFEEDDPAQQTYDHVESHEPLQPMSPDCSYHQNQLANSQFQLKQPGMRRACWQADEPPCCDCVYEPDLMDGEPALDALQQPHMMHNQQYEASQHAVHAQPYLSQQKQQRQHQDAQQELPMQIPQSEQEWQQQHGQQDDPLMSYGPDLVPFDHPSGHVTSQAPSWASHTDTPEEHCIALEHTQPSGSGQPDQWIAAEDMHMTNQDGIMWQPHGTEMCEEDEEQDQPERRPQLAIAIAFWSYNLCIAMLMGVGCSTANLLGKRQAQEVHVPKLPPHYAAVCDCAWYALNPPNSSASQAGADAARAGTGSKQAGVMLQRSKWTALVGLVLHSQVPSPLAGYALPPGKAQVYLFQNYALLQRPPHNCLKALEKFSWQNFGLDVEVHAFPSGAITLCFGAKSDPLSQHISALVLHLYNSEVKQEVTTGKAPALAAVTEAKMIKVALEDALMKLKDHFHGFLCNKVERRLQLCLPYLAKSLSKLVVNSENADLQTHACQLMSCEIDYLQQELEIRLQDAAAAELHTALLPM
ncbi:hypothetical protein WJX77_008301 [Trebouxia sp. C0004]